MEINHHTNLFDFMERIPESEEMLFPFLDDINSDTTVTSLSVQKDLPIESITHGLKNVYKRAQQNSCDYDAMRKMLVKPNAVNIAGFVSFLWQNEFIQEMKRFAKVSDIELNINIFPKHDKKTLQNYLALCNSADDLPEIFIGKGFSSLVTRRFIEKFVSSGIYQNNTFKANHGVPFVESNLLDNENHYHPIAVEETVMIHDTTLKMEADLPLTWADLLKPEYSNCIMQMGKNKRDHFGFNMMVYMHHLGGDHAVKAYAKNVFNKQHFAYIIKHMGSAHKENAPLSIVHQYAARFIRSSVHEKIELVKTEDANPVACYYFLAKNNITEKAHQMAQHLYSQNIRNIVQTSGATHITSDCLSSGNTDFQWIGWDTIKSLDLPFTKEYLSEIAFQHYHRYPS